MSPPMDSSTNRCRYPISQQPYQECGVPLSGKGRSKFCEQHGPLAWETRPLSDPTTTSTERVKKSRKKRPFLYQFDTAAHNNVRKIHSVLHRVFPELSPLPATIQATSSALYLSERLSLVHSCLPYAYLLKSCGYWEHAKQTRGVLETISSLKQQDFTQFDEEFRLISLRAISDLKCFFKVPVIARWRETRFDGLANLGFYAPDITNIVHTEILYLIFSYAAAFKFTAQDLRDLGLPAKFASFYHRFDPSELFGMLPPITHFFWVFSNGLKIDFTMPHRVPPKQVSGPRATNLWEKSGRPILIGLEDNLAPDPVLRYHLYQEIWCP